MKIGELSKKCNISKDAIRYYVEIGLLIPQKDTAQMNFTEREYEDLVYIQKMKKLRFNIKEIQASLTLRRLSNLIEPDTIQAYMDILCSRRENITSEIEILQNALSAIDTEIAGFSAKKKALVQETGVPLKALSYLTCPECHKKLKIRNAEINNTGIYSGEMYCECGYQAEIDGGIIKTGNLYTGNYDSPDLKRGLYRDVGEEFITGIQKCSDMMMAEIQKCDWHGKVIMETNINGYFFLYNNFNKMDQDALYIITDRYPEMLFMYKNLMEMLQLELDVLFIADDSLRFPIRDESVDLLIDFYGSNEQFLYKQESFIESYQKFIKKEGMVLGALFGFERNSKSLTKVPQMYPECSGIALDVKAMLDTYKKAGMKIDAAMVAATQKTYDRYSFRCHVEGEKLEQYFYKAEF